MEFRAILVGGIGNTGEYAFFSYMIDTKDWSKSPVSLLVKGKLLIIKSIEEIWILGPLDITNKKVYPIFEGQKHFLRSFYSEILNLCMVSI